MSEDTPDNVELHHFENVFQGNMSPNPLALMYATPPILSKIIPPCFEYGFTPFY